MHIAEMVNREIFTNLALVHLIGNAMRPALLPPICFDAEVKHPISVAVQRANPKPATITRADLFLKALPVRARTWVIRHV
jgi:hypothetical protein